MIGARTRLFALLGRPVGHSLSPAIHNAAFRVLGLDAAYVALDCAPEDLAPLMRGIARGGGGGNVTIPYKAEAARALPEVGAASTACNTFWGEDGLLRGTNTDPAGVRQGLAQLGHPGLRWLLVGTGGSARGVLLAAAEAGASIAVQSRSAERAQLFARYAAEAGVALVDRAECEVIVNTTPLGMQPDDRVPVSLASLPRARGVLDLVYRRGETSLVRAARALGLAAADGREVLLGQGAAAFGCWFPGRKPPMDVMRAALRDHLD